MFASPILVLQSSSLPADCVFCSFFAVGNERAKKQSDGNWG